MATLRNKRKLIAMNREYHEGKYPRNIQAGNTNSLRIQDDYITQVSEEIEGRMTNKMSQEFNKTENGILGAL